MTIPYQVKLWCNSITMGYITKWLNHYHNEPKKITYIGMTHTSDDLSGELLEQAILSQNLVLKRLHEIKPKAVGIEGYAGNIFTLQNYTAQQVKVGSKIGKVISRKNFIGEWMKNLDRYAPIYYVHSNASAIGFGIESIDLFKEANKLYENKQWQKIKEQSTARTWYSVARQSEIFSKTRQIHIVTPVGANHINHLDNLLPIAKEINIEIECENC